MASRKPELRQFAALPFHYDADGDPHVYLVTSRGGGGWIIPKVNPIRGLAPHMVAAREALEEAGLVGQIQHNCIGTFDFVRRRDGTEANCHVDVYALEVDRQLLHWAEAGQRSVMCFSLATALSLLTVPSLSILIEQFMAGQAQAV